MGAWDTGNFGNDAAHDFVAELTGAESLLRAFDEFEQTTGEFDAEMASAILAACEFLAVAIGRPPIDLPDSLPFQMGDVSSDLLDRAKKLVGLVRTDSELAELWAEAEYEHDNWQGVLDDLLLRLTPSQPYEPPAKNPQKEVPDDFLGHCYICFGPVTERDGIYYEHGAPGEGVCAVHPHRACLEGQSPGPHWNSDGSPNEATQKQMRQHMGFTN